MNTTPGLAAFFTALAASGAILVTGCEEGDRGASRRSTQVRTALPPTQVELVEARAEPIAVPIIVSGTMAALQTSNIGALVEGPVDRIFVRVGDRVRKGQPLFRIRQADFARRVVEAEAAVELARAQVEQAERAHARIAELNQRGYAPAARLEDALAARDVARAQRGQAAAVLGTARQALNDTVVRAPFDGVVTGRLVDEGVFLTSRLPMGGQSAALQLQELRIVAAIVAVPESRAADLRLNLPARLFIEGVAEPKPSYVAIINDRVDPQTRTVEARLPVRNENYGIKTGVSVRAEITPKALQAVVLPRTALAGDDAQRYAFVAKGGVVERRSVRTADIDLNRVRVIDGIAAGEQVVVSPPSTLTHGARVVLAAADNRVSGHVAR